MLIWYLLLLFSGLCVFVGRKLIWRTLKSLKELIVFVGIFFGERSYDHRSSSFRSKLHCYVLEADLVDEATVNDIYTLGVEHMDTDFSADDFHQKLLKQSYIALFRDRVAGTLRGFLFVRFIRKEKYTLVNPGTAVINRQYRTGDGTFQIPVSYVIIKELLCHPFVPTYSIAKLFGYKSYLVLYNTWPECTYPCHDKKTPEYMKDIMEDFAHSIMNEGEEYDRDRCVLKRRVSVLKEFDSVISEEDLKNPHIKFYAENNPGYKNGDCMIVMSVLDWKAVFNIIKRTVLKATGSKRHSGHQPKRLPSPKFGRQQSFIDQSTGRYYVPSDKVQLLHTGGGFVDTAPSSQETRSPYLYRRSTLSSLSSDSIGSIDIEL